MNFTTTIHFVAALVLAIFTVSPCAAQGPKAQSVTGTFYVSVDDKARIYVDGKEVHDAKNGESRSSEIELKVGQRIVVQIDNDGGKRRFMMAFLSSDQKTVISFKHRDLKIVNQPDVTDFTPEQFGKWTKYSEEEKHDAVFTFKNYSEWIWGDLTKCIVAGTVTEDMIKTIAK